MAKEHQPSLFGPAPPPWEEDDQLDQLLASVVVIDGPAEPLTYSVPDSLREQVVPGVRVKAPLGGRHNVTGYCVGLETGQREYRVRPITTVLDAEPLLNSRLIALTQWMAEYYLCDWAHAIEAAVPTGVRKQAGTRVVTFLSVTDQTRSQLDDLKLPPKQREAIQVLIDSPHPLTPNELASRAGCSSGPIQSLRKKKLVQEETRRVYSMADADSRPWGRSWRASPRVGAR